MPTSAYLKFLGVIGLVLVLVGAGMWITDKDKQIVEVNKKNAVLEHVNDNLNDGIEKDAKADAVKETVNTQVTVEVKDTKKKIEKIKQDAQKAETAAVKGVGETLSVKKPEDPNAAKLQLDYKLSEIRIDMLWKVYCETQPDASGCQPTKVKTAEAEPSELKLELQLQGV